MARITIQGGNRFRPGQTGTPRAQQVGNLFSSQGTQDLSNAVIGVGVDALNKRSRAIDVDYIADSNVKAQQEIQQIRSGLLADMEDPKGYSENFMEKANKVYDKFIADAPSEESRQSLTSNFAGQRVQQGRAAFDTENQAIVDNIVSNAAENVNLISNNIIDNPTSLVNGLDQLSLLGESVDQVLDEANTKKFLKESSRSVGNAFIKGMVGQGKFEGALKAIDSKEVKGLFTPDERQAFKRSVSAAASDNLKKLKKNREVEVDTINDDFLKAEMGNTLNVTDVMDSTLPATGPRSKDFWLKRLEKTEIDSPGNPRLYNRVYDNVENLTEDEIFDMADPTNIGTNGRPLNMDQVESLLKSKRKETDETLKNYFGGIKNSLTGSNPMTGFKDPQGDVLFMQLKFEAEKMIKEGKDQGVTPRQMFDPSSPRFEEFGGLLFNKYKRSPAAIMESMSKGLSAADEKTPKKSASDRLGEILGK